MSWKHAGDIAFYAAALVTILFALLYLIFAPWWKTLAGRNIMAVMGSVALAFGYFAWAIAVGGVPVALHPMRAFLFTGIALSVGWRVAILIKYHILPQKRGERNELEDSR